MDVQFDPAPQQWGALLTRASEADLQATFLGRSAREWRERSRRELKIPTDRPVIATGHEAVLWHPGILAKYIALSAWAKHCGAACVHLVVDQHVGGFCEINVPVRGDQGALAIKPVQLGVEQPDVPMGWHAPLDPPAMRNALQPALPSVRDGLDQIIELVRAHHDAPNAAAQMGRVLDALLSPWIDNLPGVTASDLMNTSLARAMVQAMVDDPRAAVEHYNNAVAHTPEAGIGGLAVSTSAVELPLWRIGSDGKRQRAFDHDAREWLNDPAKFALLPRALTMTALLRLGVCDVFIHGFGGARYDPAMEQWMASWLGAVPQPIVMVTATLRLPFASHDEKQLDERVEKHRMRHTWHDPTRAGDAHEPTAFKQDFIDRINAAPRRSVERRSLYIEMHERLATLRAEHATSVEAARKRFQRATQQRKEREIVERRTWPFPFYPRTMIDQLADAITQRVSAGCSEAQAAATSVRSPAQ